MGVSKREESGHHRVKGSTTPGGDVRPAPLMSLDIVYSVAVHNPLIRDT